MHKTILPLFVAVAFCPIISLQAKPLTEAHVTKVINDVKLLDPAGPERAARLNDVVRDQIALTTGIKSRSELLFEDNTLTRLGPDSYFSFKSGTRDMTLEKGTLLLQVPKGLGGAKIHTAAVTAAITGTTIMMEYVPKQDLKVLVLEGSLRLSVNGTFGDSLLLTPGKMVIMPPNAKRIPDPVTVDIKKIIQTSSLVNMHSGKKMAGAPLPSMPLINQEIDRQEKGKGKELIDTNLVILGKGTNVLLASDDLMQDLALRTDVGKTKLNSALDHSALDQPAPAATPVPTPNPAPTPNSNPSPSGTPPPPPLGNYIIDNTTVINTQGAAPTITTQGITNSGVYYKDLKTNGSPAGFLFGAASSFDNELGFDTAFLQHFQQSAVFAFDTFQLGGGITFNLGEPKNVVLVGDNGITNSLGSVLNLGGINNALFATESGDIVLNSGISFGGSAEKPSFVGFYARGGDVNIGSTFTLPSTTLQFSAENNAIFSPTASFTAKNLTVTGLQSVQFDANATVNSLFQLDGGAVEIGGVVNAKTGYLYGSSATLNGSFTGENFTGNVTGDFALNGPVSLTGNEQLKITAGGAVTIGMAPTSSNLTVNAHDILFTTDVAMAGNLKGELTANGGKIDATGHQLTGFDQITLTNANLFAGGLSANNIVITGTGNIDITNDFTLTKPLTTSNSVTVGGLLTDQTVTTGDITTNGLHTNTLTSSGIFTLTSTDLAPLGSNTVAINAPTVSFAAGAILDGQNGTLSTGPKSAWNMTISTGAFTLDAPVSLNGGDADPSRTDQGGNGGQLNLTSSDAITLNAPISATTGQNSNAGMNGGQGGKVNLTANNTVTLNSTIQVSSNAGRRRSNSSGSVNITSNKTSGTAIAVNSSAQILALLNASSGGGGGSIKFVSAGGDINVNGASMQADKGTIDLHNNGTGGLVALNNANLNASTIKVGALGNNGTLNIGGGTISADSLIHLYAGGSNGTINFTDNVSISGNSAKTIAGDTVTIYNGKIVTVNGPSPADVYTNHPNYTGYGGNGSTTGTFAGQGANTHPLSLAPGY